ncbi:hypothetical protein [Flavobacterium columnare]|uniref:hypothetical protein n=1 Tax=Flavobacterium columnare TaxID=996 RepID=UPI003BA355A9
MFCFLLSVAGTECNSALTFAYICAIGLADALNVTTDYLIYGSSEQIINDKLKDEELLQLFNKIQFLKPEEITSVKTMLKAFVFQKDIQKQLS